MVDRLRQNIVRTFIIETIAQNYDTGDIQVVLLDDQKIRARFSWTVRDGGDGLVDLWDQTDFSGGTTFRRTVLQQAIADGKIEGSVNALLIVADGAHRHKAKNVELA